MFFKRVQNGREDKKWEARGEQVCTNLLRFNNSTSSLSANDGKLRRRVKHRKRMTQ
jgi:hypothetical protein